jgi:hypothetical protein
MVDLSIIIPVRNEPNLPYYEQLQQKCGGFLVVSQFEVSWL